MNEIKMRQLISDKVHLVTARLPASEDGGDESGNGARGPLALAGAVARHVVNDVAVGAVEQIVNEGG